MQRSPIIAPENDSVKLRRKTSGMKKETSVNNSASVKKANRIDPRKRRRQ
jgi:hypothetical protein